MGILKNCFACGAVVVVILIIAVVVFVTNDDSDSGDFDSSKAYLYVESGDVSIKKQDENDYTKVETDEVALQSKTYVKTEESFAHVVFPNESVMSLDNNTEVQITYDDEDTSIFQFIGSTWHRIEELVGAQEYSIETSSTLAAVRGTKVGVDNDGEEETDVYVLENKVEVSTLIEKDGKKVKEDTQIFGEGEEANVGKLKKIIRGEISEKRKKKSWFKKNKDLDNMSKEDLYELISGRRKEEISELRGDKNVFAGINDDTFCSDFESKYNEYKEVHESLIGVNDSLYDQIAKFVNKVTGFCSDGKLTFIEKLELKVYASIFQIIIEYVDVEIEEEESAPEDFEIEVGYSDKYDEEMRKVIDSYLHLDGKGEEMCTWYLGKTVEEIMEGITVIQVENGYDPIIKKEIRPLVEQIVGICKDGKISKEEYDSIKPIK